MPVSCSDSSQSAVAFLASRASGLRNGVGPVGPGDRLEGEIGPEYAVLLDLLAIERDGLKAAGRSTEGLDWQSALDSDMLGLIRNGDLDHARERLQTCLSSSSD